MTKAKQPYTGDIPEIFRDAIDSLTEGFALFDSDHRLVVCNQANRKMSQRHQHLYEPGATREHIVREEAKYDGYRDTAGNDAAGQGEDWISQQLAAETQSIQSREMERSDGSCHLVSTYPTRLGGLVVTTRDVTEKKQIEAEKRNSDDLVRMVLESSASAVIMSRMEDGEIIYRSPSAKEMYGVHKSAISHFANPQDRNDYLAAILPTGRVDNFRASYKRANGEVFIASNAGRVAEYRGEKVIVSNVTDISKQQEADALIRTVLDASSAIVSMVGLDSGEVIYRTPAALKLFGDAKTAKENYANPQERDEFVRQLKIHGHVEDYKLDFINSEGRQFPVSLSSKIIDYKGEQVIVTNLIDLTEQVKTEAIIRKVLEACPVPVQMTKADTGELLFRSPETTALFGEIQNAKHYYVRPEERKQYLEGLRRKGWIEDFKAEFNGAGGRPFWGHVSARLIEFNGEDVIVSNTRDLTNDLAMEDELSHQRDMLFQNEKMSALGGLLAGVAHELNNPLSIVVGHSMMLREEVEDPEIAERIEKISIAAERCAKIVKTFLAMARQQPTKMQATNINSIISIAVDVAGYGKGNELLAIKCDLDSNVPEIMADGDQITQVIINLVVNAEQAITKADKGDLITVTTSRDKSGDAIEIVVQDNGPGIPEHNRARVFEPYFTTKDVGEGTGIGLAFCHRIIQSHGGQLLLDNSYVDGCRFVITLPAHSRSATPSQASKTHSRSTAKATALVVDDEVDVAELIAEILEKEGYGVTIAHSVTEAIRCLRETNYDLMLSDLNMPEMGGRELYEILKQEFPKMLNATAFISGDTMGASSQALRRESQRPLLEKPVSPTELRQLVYAMLNRNENGADL